MNVDLIDHMGSDVTVVNAARVSFNKAIGWDEPLKDGDKKLINYLASHGHWTPFAHPQITLRVKAPIFIRTQCFKHKQGFTENEVSRRYVDEDPTFFTPDVWRGKPKNSKQGSSNEVIESLYQYTDDNGNEYRTSISKEYYNFLDHALNFYSELIVDGVAPEQARMILPQSMYTEWYWTGSLAAYARFYKQRSDTHAQKEVQDLASKVGEVIQPLFPVSWVALTSSEALT